MVVEGDQERLQAFLLQCFSEGHEEGDDQRLDFQKIIPMPACLQDSEESSSVGDAANLLAYAAGNFFSKPPLVNKRLEKAIRDAGAKEQITPFHDCIRRWIDLNGPEVQAGRARMMRIAETGYSSWYGWSVAHWGTKWNSYRNKRHSLTDTTLVHEFWTAWAFPTPILSELRKHYPDLTFGGSFHDEYDDMEVVHAFPED